MLSIENPFIMEIQRLIDLGKQMNLEGEKLCEFVLAQQAVDRDERFRIRQEKIASIALVRSPASYATRK